MKVMPDGVGATRRGYRAEAFPVPLEWKRCHTHGADEMAMRAPPSGIAAVCVSHK